MRCFGGCLLVLLLVLPFVVSAEGISAVQISTANSGAINDTTGASSIGADVETSVFVENIIGNTGKVDIRIKTGVGDTVHEETIERTMDNNEALEVHVDTSGETHVDVYEAGDAIKDAEIEAEIVAVATSTERFSNSLLSFWQKLIDTLTFWR